jgi:LytS/YehU family sensor histidine kinase
MLEDLIVYLRAALPHLRESTSTLEQEATLVRSWLDIVGRTESRWRIGFALDPEVRDARLPALLLLPLAQCAVAGAEGGELRLQVAAHAAGGQLRITVATSTPAFAAGIAAQPVLAQIDQRLRALHAGAATLDVHTHAGGSEARIALPLESIPATDEPGALP